MNDIHYSNVGMYRFGWDTGYECTSLAESTLPKRRDHSKERHQYRRECVWVFVEGNCHVTIHAPAGSYAEQYAMMFGIPFVAV